MHKVVLIGDSGVGKTCLLARYNTNKFRSQTPTIGATFSTKRLLCNDEVVALQLWDTAGQERFKSMLPMYYRGAACAVICFDSMRAQTAENVKNWVKELQMHADDDILIVINCTKCDLLRETSEWRTFIKNYLNKSNRSDNSSSADRTGSYTSITSTSTGSPPHQHDPNSQSPISEANESTNGADNPFGVTGIYNDPSYPFYDMIQYAQSINAIYVETSSKDNEGIDEMFLTIAKKLIESHRKRHEFSSQTSQNKGARSTDDDFLSTTSSSYSLRSTSPAVTKTGGCCGLGGGSTPSTGSQTPSPRTSPNTTGFSTSNIKPNEKLSTNSPTFMTVRSGLVDDRFR
ncbi:hypothetical protein C9374_009728 [Naegleria lovaniensis]|uniref:Rab family small GTPase n=1 Tax=Naegleria lovaniensis TaxID=51637 RepID=A0AA88H3E8_NAELO|nr:uncharacterized protein C9374_009728 [Naegleria lovaniensis]KAG2393151.1 hypothetical protein C9374_009728 [Naegleria lovaniensis]